VSVKIVYIISSVDNCIIQCLYSGLILPINYDDMTRLLYRGQSDRTGESIILFCWLFLSTRQVFASWVIS